MLLTVDNSKATKTRGLAVTYRSGNGDMYTTCPKSCALNPSKGTSTQKIDYGYLRSLLGAVPKKGAAFTYSHFHWEKWAPKMWEHQNKHKQTVTINYSADTKDQAWEANYHKVPCVIALPEDQVKKHWVEDDVRYVQCPATYQDHVGCSNCGGDTPLCARPYRDYVVVFPAHGAKKKLVGDEESGGCYASTGHVAIHWKNLVRKVQEITDGEKVKDWVKSLPPRTILRHHIAGDIGKE